MIEGYPGSISSEVFCMQMSRMWRNTTYASHLSTNGIPLFSPYTATEKQLQGSTALRLFVVQQGEETEQARTRGWMEYRGKVLRLEIEKKRGNKKRNLMRRCRPASSIRPIL